MKKFLALTLAGAMLLATPVMAAEDVEDEVVEDVEDADGESGSKSPSASTVKPKPKKETEEEQPAAPIPPVEASSVPAAVVQAAAAEGKTVGEYMNNMVVAVPGLDNAVPIGQGGHVILNGAPSN